MSNNPIDQYQSLGALGDVWNRQGQEFNLGAGNQAMGGAQPSFLDSLQGFNTAPSAGQDWSLKGMSDGGNWGGANAQPVAGGQGGFLGWLNKDHNLSTSFQGLQALSSAYLGFQALKQAKANAKFQRGAFNTNLANQTQTYNTSLEDRINGRTAAHDGKDQEVQAYLASHELTQKHV